MDKLPSASNGDGSLFFHIRVSACDIGHPECFFVIWDNRKFSDKR